MCEKTNSRGTHQYYIDTDLSHHAPGKYRYCTMLRLPNSLFKSFSKRKNGYLLQTLLSLAHLVLFERVTRRSMLIVLFS